MIMIYDLVACYLLAKIIDMQKADQLIRTKLRPPFTRLELVPRPRLQERIAEGLRRPLPLIVAPAGFGKTTLMAACVPAVDMPLAWLSLDKNNNQAGRFLIKTLHGTNIVGQGGKIILFILPALIAAILVHAYLSRFTALPEGLSFIRPVGYLLFAFGLIFWEAAVIQLVFEDYVVIVNRLVPLKKTSRPDTFIPCRNGTTRLERYS